MLYLLLGIIIGIIATKAFYCVLFYKEIKEGRAKLKDRLTQD